MESRKTNITLAILVVVMIVGCRGLSAYFIEHQTSTQVINLLITMFARISVTVILASLITIAVIAISQRKH